MILAALFRGALIVAAVALLFVVAVQPEQFLWLLVLFGMILICIPRRR